MKPETAKKILDINREFYQTFAGQFSATRQRLQPGVQKILRTIPSNGSIIDIGCGNGEIWHTLKQLNFKGSYLGLDFSSNLLETALRDEADYALAGSGSEAALLFASNSEKGIFLQADLSSDDWDAWIPAQSFEIVFCFAVLHHIPANYLRQKILTKIHRLLKSDGYFYHSNWQFLNSPKLSARIQSWQTVEIDETDLDPGDYLLDWKAGGYGLRYAHQYSEGELTDLARQCRFHITGSFYSDGESGNLGLYQTWQAIQKG